MDVAFLEVLVFIMKAVLAILVLISLNRISRKFGQAVIDPSRAWKITSGLITTGRWMIIVSSALIVPLMLTMLMNDATLSVVYFLITGKLVVTRALTAAAFVVIGTLFWRILLRWSAKTLILRFQQTIQARLSEHPPQQTLKFIGQLCFAVCAATLQLVGMACLLVICGAFNSETENDDSYNGVFYNYLSGKWVEHFEIGCYDDYDE